MFRVAIVYAIVAWAVIEVTNTVFPRLGLPDWSVTLVVALALVGAPIALVLAWAFDLTPEGVMRTPASSARASTPALVGLGVVLALGGVGAYAVFGGRGEPRSVASDRSVAVLPFSDLSPERNQEYLADGITEHILTKLGVISGLRVPSRTSVMQYKGTTKHMREIGRELGVAHILEGSVQRDGERVRITAQLIRADTDEHLWAQNYDRRLDDIFAIQDEIAREIADALRVRLTAGEAAQLARRPTDNLRAYELYLRGRFFWNKRTPPDVATAIDYFRQALEEDPSYALAYAGLAEAYVLPT